MKLPKYPYGESGIYLDMALAYFKHNGVNHDYGFFEYPHYAGLKPDISWRLSPPEIDYIQDNWGLICDKC